MSDSSAVAASVYAHSQPVPTKSRHLTYRVLEPRMVFDAALTDTLTDVAHSGTAEGATSGTAASSEAGQDVYVFRCVMPVAPDKNPAETDVVQVVCELPSAKEAASIVFIDPSVTNAETLLPHIAANAEIVYLTSETDGLQQIAAHVAGRSNIQSIHILSHGGAGAFVIGGSVVSADFTEASQDVFAAIGQSLAPP
jgi:hypothetical protein